MRRFYLIAVAGIVACTNVDVPPTVGLVTHLSSTDITIGSPVTVTVTATNASGTTAQIDAGGCDHFIVLTGDVFTDRGQVVGPAATNCTIGSSPHSLEPGESFTFTTQWAGEAASAAIKTPPDTLAAGSYYVEGKVQVIGGIVIRSDPIPVTLHR